MAKQTAEQYNNQKQSDIVTKIIELMGQGKQPCNL
jgi:hypothetical protein